MTGSDGRASGREVHDPARTARRSLLTWLAACAVGGGLALLASGRTWATVTFNPQPGTLGSGSVALTGTELVASLTPAALAALAAAAAVLATRGVARKAIGVVIAFCGIAVLAGSWDGTRPGTIASTAREHATTAMVSSGGFAAESPAWAWPLAAMAGGLVLVAGGAAVVARGGRWPGMSSRYDRPGGESRTGSGGADGERPARGGERTGERALWDALDEGADPTLEPPPDTSP